MRFIFILLVSAIALQSAIAQVKQLRYETNISLRNEDFAVFPAGENGLVFLRQVRGEHKVDFFDVQVNLLDPFLRTIATDTLITDPSFELKRVIHENKQVFLIYEQSEIEIPSYKIVKIDFSSGRVQPFSIKNELPFDLVKAMSVRGKIYFGGYVRGVPTIMVFEEGKSTLSLLPVRPLSADFLDLSLNNDQESINLVTQERSGNVILLHVTTYGGTSMLFQKTIVMQNEAVTARSLGFINGNIIIAGTYGSNKLNLTQGTFMVSVQPGKDKDVVHYHGISEFDHFFDYADVNQKERLTEKVERKSVSGNDIKFNKVLFVNDLQLVGDELLMDIEMFQLVPRQIARQRRVRNSYGNFGGSRSNPHNGYGNNVFADALYPDKLRLFRKLFFESPSENAEVIPEFLQRWSVGFDPNGLVKWDNSMAVQEQDRASAAPLTAAAFDDTVLRYGYKHEEGIVYAESSFGSTKGEEFIFPLVLKNENESLVYELNDVNGLWSINNDVFYAWGSHRVKGDSGRRNVIYINALFFPEVIN
ncbi:hypothetical protein [Fulvivirga sedimenti]|uniref:Uncharacterized protein n=1 Tax=Fulvivirga sedimenti TaxID=2879465 RepID=A0A9X1HNF9_9BACT|nr:hypothetical protein [Fulvivirga sedimenti]MCA6075388.1 hypothetical protein [Fulvivirga sedimenti]MCA6076565.1 hypothetical protein [Fulvivirga sedimenti]MCA6077693.1 hypothetical protein [Fulvivirga sedimenti]